MLQTKYVYHWDRPVHSTLDMHYLAFDRDVCFSCTVTFCRTVTASSNPPSHLRQSSPNKRSNNRTNP